MFNNPGKKDIYILGAGSVGRDVLEIYRELEMGDCIKGFVEENSIREGQEIDGIKIFNDSVLESLDKKVLLVAAIGLPIKQSFVERTLAMGFSFDTVVHPAAIIGSEVIIGEGCIVFPGVFLTHDIKIGKHSIINVGSNISHDCFLGDYITICPGVNIAGKVFVDSGTWIGIGATIINKINIGRRSLIAAGAVVTSDVSDGVVVGGMPAKIIRKWKDKDWIKIV